MTQAREIMHAGAECIGANDTLDTAARKMRDLQVGALPVCGPDNRLQGLITDRDIVIRCLAEGRDHTTTTAGELVQGTPIWVDANADDTEVLQLMEQHKIRRLPVMEGQQVVGMISEADLVINLPEDKVVEFVEKIYSAPPNL